MSELESTHRSIGLLGISPTPKLDASFEQIWNGIGKNSGNLFFTEAVFRILNEKTERIDWDFDPVLVNERFSKVVIPASNWINTYSDWGGLIERLKQLEIPVIMLGVGLQAPSGLIYETQFHPSALELMKTISRKSHSIGVRGELTRSWLTSQGILNAQVIGCPSMFLRLDSNRVTNPSGLVIQGTKYFATANFGKKDPSQAAFFKFAFREKLDVVYQSEFEEIEYLIKREQISRNSRDRFKVLIDQYGADDPESLEEFIKIHGKVFFSIDQWAGYLATKAGHLGSRIHGSIMAMNSNVPSVMFAHDSRTQEMADYAGIPSLKSGEVRLLSSIREAEKLIENVDLAEYGSIRARNADTFREFLTSNGLGFQESRLF